MPKPKFNVHERCLLTALENSIIPLTARALADMLGIGWETSSRNLNKLHSKGFVDKTTSGNRTYWHYKK
ncbi:hypothetical protein BEH94_06025 [Candidatus Altiarchaeales archaeon WOR_SM1_SCG]|nr:hypothetical protein BEH94_06025 [Candidatus Altiarchaeales archaeon WOR_SM1_SCG]